MYNYIDTAIMKKLFLAFVLALGFGAVASAGDTYAHDASVLPQSVGEQPDIAHPHSRTYTGQHKSQRVLESAVLMNFSFS